MLDLILVRGLPGAGKTSFVKNFLPKYNHYEADMYFDEFNLGKFDPKLLPNAHNWCAMMVETSLKNNLSVIVSNTFTQQWEMQTYILMAQRFDARLNVIVVENYHGSNSIHNVPQSTIDKMRNRFEINL